MKLSKTTIVAATFLGALALTGVGFAGWQIVSNANETHGGNITVYDITNNAVVISNQKWTNSANSDDTITESKVVFGRPATTANETSSSSWFKYDDSVEAECFPVYSFRLTDYSKSSNQPTVTATLSLSINEDGKNQDLLKAYYTCQQESSESKAYIKGPVLVEQESGGSTYKAKDVTLNHTITSDDTTTSDSQGKAYTVTVDLGFGWGTNFKSTDGNDAVNPYYYYNNIEQNDANVVNAQTAMSAIAALSGLKYTLTITATPASN